MNNAWLINIDDNTLVAHRFEDLSISPFQAIEQGLPLWGTKVFASSRHRMVINPRYIIWASQVDDSEEEPF